MPGIPLAQIAAELGFPLPGGIGESNGLMSSFTYAHMFALTIEQVDPHTNEVLSGGLSYKFEGDDLPDDLPLGGDLVTKQMIYPNNSVPDTQVIRTQEKDIVLKGHFWSFDYKGRSPLDKAELLDAIRLAGYPIKMSYIGDRFVRYGFMHKFSFTINDETDVEWEMEIEVYKHGSQVGSSGNLNAPLTSGHARVSDIVARLNSDGAALVEMNSRIASARNSLSLRGELAGALPESISALGAIAAARDVIAAAGSLNAMDLQTFKNFNNKLNQAGRSVNKVLQTVRSTKLTPATAAEAALGLAANLQRRNTTREASITFGRVKEDLALMQKDAATAFANKQTVHVVSDGDSLRSIAQKYYGDSSRWQDIAQANKITDPNRLGGRTLVIPK